MTAPERSWVARFVAEWCDIPQSLERDDPVMGAYARHAALHPLPNGQTTLVMRRALARDTR